MTTNFRSIENICVLGGGTAGWLSALYINTIMPKKNITVIESEEIGIVGAGEGSTPHFVDLLEILNIPVSTFLKEAGATLKTSIKFTNWNNEGSDDFYHHSFKPFGNVATQGYQQEPRYLQDVPSIYVTGSYLGVDLKDYDVHAKLSKENKVSFMYDPRQQDTSSQNPVAQFQKISNYALHFDAVRLARTLKAIAIERGIIHVEGIVEDFTQDESGDVKTLTLKDGKEIPTDFVFDCSGFNKFFPKKFQSEWVSYKDKLPVNSAIPFFLPMEEHAIPPHTEAIAMKYGWIWKIPLQERYGCGYVFDSTLINSQQAQKEAEEYFGTKVEVPRVISFEPGYYKTPWVNNVISVGLCSGFVEPLEATSIWMSIITLSFVLTKPETLHTTDKRIVDDFNKKFCSLNEDVLAFIYFHYMSGRDDTEFWKKFTKENAPDIVKDLLDISEYRLLSFSDFDELFWQADNWYQIALGIRQFNLDKLSKESLPYNVTFPDLADNFNAMKKVQDEVVEEWCVDHKKFVKYMKREIEKW